MICVITAGKGGIVTVLQWFSNTEPHELEIEFNQIYHPGKRPEYNTPEHKDWLGRVRERERRLVEEFGGSFAGNTPTGEIVYSEQTFANWLVAKKGFERVLWHEHYCRGDES